MTDPKIRRQKAKINKLVEISEESRKAFYDYNIDEEKEFDRYKFIQIESALNKNKFHLTERSRLILRDLFYKGANYEFRTRHRFEGPHFVNSPQTDNPQLNTFTKYVNDLAKTEPEECLRILLQARKIDMVIRKLRPGELGKLWDFTDYDQKLKVKLKAHSDEEFIEYCLGHVEKTKENRSLLKKSRKTLLKIYKGERRFWGKTEGNLKKVLEYKKKIAEF